MIHTEITLSPDVYKEVEHIAEASQRRPALVLRDLVGLGVAAWRKQPARTTGNGLGAVAHLGFKGPRDFASRLDEYMYGDE